jgi:hypothetical protein
VRRIVVVLVALLVSGLATAKPLTPTPEWLVAPEQRPTARHATSYFQQHAARVERTLLMFQHDYTLESVRERDALQLYGPTPGNEAATASGIALFSTVVVGAAHTPRALGFAFDGALHLGPALFAGGGLGAAFGGNL